MTAANTDKFRKGFYGPPTTLSAPITNSDVTIPISNTAGLPTDTAIDIVIDRVDANGDETPDKVETMTVVISGNNGTNAIRGVEDTAKSHLGGAVVEVLLTGSTHNDIIDGILVSHNQNGTLGSAALAQIYPVGSIYINASVATNPATLFGFGTWVAFGKGRVLVGLDDTQTEFDTIAETGGEKTHTLTTPEIPSHSHVKATEFGTGGTSFSDPNAWAQVNSGVGGTPGNTGTAGGGGAHNNLQPYIVVYMWQRTA